MLKLTKVQIWALAIYALQLVAELSGLKETTTIGAVVWWVSFIVLMSLCFISLTQTIRGLRKKK